MSCIGCQSPARVRVSPVGRDRPPAELPGRDHGPGCALPGARAPLLVCEATGGYEGALVAALGTAGLPVVVANPRQVRDFAKATGKLAKTDAIDAQVLALSAEWVRPEPRALPDEALTALEALLTRRRQLVEMLIAEKNHLLLARGPVRRDLLQHIRFLERRLREVDDDLHTAVKASPAWRVKDDLLRGTLRGKRLVYGGRAPVRAVLSMAALVASRRTRLSDAFTSASRPRASPPRSRSRPACGNC